MTISDNLPKLVVFDLDFTLWPCWCANHVQAPFKAGPSGKFIIDACGKEMGFFPDVPSILYKLKHEMQIPFCSASRTPLPENGKSMLSLLQLEGKPSHESFMHNVWGTGSKIQHFKQLHELTGIDYKDMLFFDDEPRNRDVEEEFGVTFILVTEEEGVCWDSFDRGIKLWQERN